MPSPHLIIPPVPVVVVVGHIILILSLAAVVLMLLLEVVEVNGQLKAMLPDVETRTVFKGVTPFWVLDIVRLALLVFIPGIALYLPAAMG